MLRPIDAEATCSSEAQRRIYATMLRELAYAAAHAHSLALTSSPCGCSRPLLPRPSDLATFGRVHSLACSSARRGPTTAPSWPCSTPCRSFPHLGRLHLRGCGQWELESLARALGAACCSGSCSSRPASTPTGTSCAASRGESTARREC